MSISDTNKARRYASIAEVAAAEAKIYADKIILAPDYAAQAQAAANIAVAASETAVGVVNEVSAYATAASESATSAAASAASAGNAAGAAIGRSLRVPDGELIAEFPASSGRVNTVPTFDASGNVSVKDLADFATLDSSGKLPVSVIPSIALSQPFVVSSQAQMLALDAQVGDIAKRTDLGYSFCLAAEPTSTLSNWVQLTDDVLSILADKTGATAIGAEDDAGAPTTVQGLLNAKVNKADLSSTSGSALVGMAGGGKLKDVVTWVTPEQFGAVSYDRRTIFGSNKNSAADIAAAVAAGTVVDSTSAIQQAVNTGNPVFFKSGVYYTSSPIIQGYYTGDMIGDDVVQTGICKYTSTTDTSYGVDAVWILGTGTGAYMRYKKISGIAFARAKLLANSGTLQQPKAVQNYFDFTDVNLIPYGYGLYAPKADHLELTNVLLHGSETNFYTSDLWMSRINNVWSEGGTGFVIETGTSTTFTAVWSSNASWSTYDTSGNLIKKHYCYDLGGVYHNFESLAADFCGADGRPSESIYNFRQGAIVEISSLGVEQCNARRILGMTAGGSGLTTSFVNIETVSVDLFHNKYADTSLVAKRRVLLDVPDFCSLNIKSGRIRCAYADTTTAPNKPHIGYVGKKARMNLGNTYFITDTIKGIQLNDVSYFKSINTTTGVISPIAVTASEVWVDSDTFQASSFTISNGITDISVSSSGSDLYWDNGSATNTGQMSHHFGGYQARALTGDVAQFRAQNDNRSFALVVSGTSGGLFDYTTGRWILQQDQGAGGSSLNLGSTLNQQDAAINFQTSGTNVAYSSRLLARTVSGSNYIYAQGNFLAPFTDNATNLGGAAARWVAVYAVNGAIQTSDGTKKINKKEIDSAVLDAWDEVEFYQYQWKDEEIKDADGASHGMRHDSRTHYGVIAQEIVAAFERHGIDALETGVVTFENDEYGVSYSSAMVLEMACMRRKLSTLN